MHLKPSRCHYRCVISAWILVVSATLWCRPTVAHNGPSFPIIMDKPLAGYIVSLWVHPDLAPSPFYVVLAPQPGHPFLAPTRVAIAVQPLSKRLPEATYEGRRQWDQNNTQYLVTVPFDKQEQWHVRLILHGPTGASVMLSQVEPTPNDLGKLGLLLYLVPFLAVGFIYAKGAVFERRRRDAWAAAHATVAAESAGTASAGAAANSEDVDPGSRA